MLGLRKIDTVAILCADDEQTSLSIKTRRAIVSGTAFVRCNQPSIAGRLLRRIGNRTPTLVHARGPVDGGEGRRKQAFSASAVQHKEITVPRGLQQHLARSAFELRSEEHTSELQSQSN